MHNVIEPKAVSISKNGIFDGLPYGANKPIDRIVCGNRTYSELYLDYVPR